MLIFMIELITEFIYVLLKLVWHQSNSFQKEKKFSKYFGFEFNVKFYGHVGILNPYQLK